MKRLFLTLAALLLAAVSVFAAEEPRAKAKRLGYANAAPGWVWVDGTGPDGLALKQVDADAGKIAAIGGSLLPAPVAQPQQPPVVNRAAEYANPFGPYYAPQQSCPNGKCPFQR